MSGQRSGRRYYVQRRTVRNFFPAYQSVSYTVTPSADHAGQNARRHHNRMPAKRQSCYARSVLLKMSKQKFWRVGRGLVCFLWNCCRKSKQRSILADLQHCSSYVRRLSECGIHTTGLCNKIWRKNTYLIKNHRAQNLWFLTRPTMSYEYSRNVLLREKKRDNCRITYSASSAKLVALSSEKI